VTIAVIDALVRAQLGESAQAEGMLRRTAELDPKRALALAYVANFDARRGDLDQADAESREALAREPGSDLARSLRIEILCLRGDYAAALAESSVAIRSGTWRTLVWSCALEAARMTGAYDSVLEGATRVLGEDPGRGDAREFVLQCLHSLGRFEPACALLAGELRRRPEDPRIQEALASFLFDAGRWTEAAAQLESLSRDPRRAGGLQRALEIARKRERAAGLQAEDAPARELYESGRFAKASEALERDPEDGPGAALFAARCAARGAEDAWRALSRGSPIPASARAGSGSAVEPEERGDDRSNADRLANRALECLERELERQRAELAAQRSDEGRAPSLHSLAGQLDERDLVFVREPPPGASWSGRARTYFWRVREILGPAHRPRR
jgi:predicted Zn-dependent protease